MTNNSKEQSTRRYDEEEVLSIMEEIQWRDQEIRELKEYIHNERCKIAEQNKPRNYPRILFISFVSFIVSTLPVFAYGRNAWQMTAYYINKALWETKEWWY